MTNGVKNMKKVKQFNESISVFFDKEYNVYKVVVKGRPEATSEEDDKQAAFDTAQAMVDHMAKEPKAYDPEPLPENVLDREGEWDIGYVTLKYAEQSETIKLWFGHYTTDEEMGCGNIWVKDGEVYDYDGVYSLPEEVVTLLTRQGYDVSYLVE